MFINKIVKNSSLSITAQFISLVVIGTLNLLVPKLVSIEQYALWQTYVLYMSYVGIFHFGLLDGIVLRYSKYDYEYLDKPRLNSQFRILFYWILLLQSSSSHCLFYCSIINIL